MDTESSVGIEMHPVKEPDDHHEPSTAQISLQHSMAKWTKPVDYHDDDDIVAVPHNNHFVEDDNDDNDSERNLELLSRRTRFVRSDTFDIFEKSNRSDSITPANNNNRKIRFNDEVTYLRRSFSVESLMDSCSRRSSINIQMYDDEQFHLDLEHDTFENFSRDIVGHERRASLLKRRGSGFKSRALFEYKDCDVKCPLKLTGDKLLSKGHQAKRLSITSTVHNELLPQHIFAPRPSLPVLFTSVPEQQTTGASCCPLSPHHLLLPSHHIGYIPVALSPVGECCTVLGSDSNLKFTPCQHHSEHSSVQGQQSGAGGNSKEKNCKCSNCDDSNANNYSKSWNEMCNNVRYNCISSVLPNLKRCECKTYQN